MGKLKDLYRSFVIGDIKNTEEEPNVDDWFSFMDRLPVPKDEYEEAYNKYRCRMYYFKKGKAVILNMISFFVLIPATIRMLFQGRRLPKLEKDMLVLEEKPDVDYRDVFPYELKDEYQDFMSVKSEKGSLGSLAGEAKALYVHAMRKYWNHPYFLLWIMKELSIHSHYIEKYNPKAFVIYINERNVASPIITKLYEDGGRKLISFMHGEYLLQLIQAYFSFSQYYVWHEEYISMFRENLKCDVSKYCVYTPVKLKKKWNLEDTSPEYDITYYFSGESTESIKRIADAFDTLTKKGKKCKIRPHPRYSHTETIKSVFSNYYIEDTKSVGMKESLQSTRYVAGLATTVLSEALAEGREIVIDDISNPQLYENLKARKFILITKRHLLLSEYLEV